MNCVGAKFGINLFSFGFFIVGHWGAGWGKQRKERGKWDTFYICDCDMLHQFACIIFNTYIALDTVEWWEMVHETQITSLKQGFYCILTSVESHDWCTMWYIFVQRLRREKLLRIFKLNTGQDDHAIMFLDDYISQVGWLYLLTNIWFRGIATYYWDFSCQQRREWLFCIYFWYVSVYLHLCIHMFSKFCALWSCVNGMLGLLVAILQSCRTYFFH